MNIHYFCNCLNSKKAETWNIGSLGYTVSSYQFLEHFIKCSGCCERRNSKPRIWRPFITNLNRLDSTGSIAQSALPDFKLKTVENQCHVYMYPNLEAKSGVLRKPTSISLNISIRISQRPAALLMWDNDQGQFHQKAPTITLRL